VIPLLPRALRRGSDFQMTARVYDWERRNRETWERDADPEPPRQQRGRQDASCLPPRLHLAEADDESA
jgi:hypothetical protein